MAKKKKGGAAASAPITAEAVPASESDVRKATTSDPDAASDDDDAASAGTEVELLQVDVGDVIKLKQVLDETVAACLLEQSEPTLPEDHTMDNVKLTIMAVACSFAVVAQFAPLPFPDSRPVLGLCCAAYFVLSGLLQLVTTFWEGDCIMITKPVEKAKFPSGNALTEKFGMRVRTQLPRFSEFYTVILEFQNHGEGGGSEKKKKKDSSDAPPPFVTKTWSVGEFFDVDGFFAEDLMMDEVEGVYTRFAKGQFDKPKDYDDGKKGIFTLLGLGYLDDMMSKNPKEKVDPAAVKQKKQ